MARINPEVWQTILAGLANGDLVRDLLAAAGIDRHVLRAHLAEAPNAQREWDAARERSADAYMDKALECALEEYDKEFATHARTRIDTFKWAARIRNPRLYGDKAQLDVNVRHVDLSAIIAAANARLAGTRTPTIVDAQVITPALEHLL